MEKRTDEIVHSLQLSYKSFRKKEVDVIGIIANKINSTEVSFLAKELNSHIPKNIQIDIIPTIDLLKNPTVREVVQELDGKVLFGKQFLDNAIGSYNSGSMQLRNYLTRIHENALVVTPGDRADIILGALQANASSNYPKIAGIILTGAILPEDSILRLIEGVQSTVPIISVQQGTFVSTNKIGSVKPKIYASNTKKILLSLNTFDTYVNAEGITSKLTSYNSDKITPNMFQYNMLQKAKENRKHIVLPEGTDERIIRAAGRLQLLDIVDLTLLGDRNSIELKCNQIGLQIDLEKINILNPQDSIYDESFTQKLIELRKHKGMTETIAKDLVTGRFVLRNLDDFKWSCGWHGLWCSQHDTTYHQTCIAANQNETRCIGSIVCFLHVFGRPRFCNGGLRSQSESERSTTCRNCTFFSAICRGFWNRSQNCNAVLFFRKFR